MDNLRILPIPCLQTSWDRLSSAVPTKGGPAKVAGSNRLYSMSESTINLADYKIHDTDTGSADYQVALMMRQFYRRDGGQFFALAAAKNRKKPRIPRTARKEMQRCLRGRSLASDPRHPCYPR